MECRKGNKGACRRRRGEGAGGGSAGRSRLHCKELVLREEGEIR